jgi:predicted 2-oxoglutarate/Fe(II)-dependent dioxygenase YbiX
MTVPALRPGEAAPFCYGVATDGQFWSLMGQAGRPLLMLAAGSLASPCLSAAIGALIDLSTAIGLYDGDIALFSDTDPNTVFAFAQNVPAGIRVIAAEPHVFASLGLDRDQPALLVVDRNARLVAVFDASDPQSASNGLLEISRLPNEEPREIIAPAPILLIPNLLEREVCAELIDRFEEGGHFDSGFAGADAAGNPAYKMDYAKKRRRDILIDHMPELHDRLSGKLLKRTAPEIKKAFQVEVAHLDRILVARYEDDGGHFRRHRDNGGSNVAFREFALSVNLNADDYEGGRLIFPEFNAHRYHIPTGAGLVFSGSLIHEALPVTRGKRYVLLTFFHSDAAEARRLA